MSPDKNQEHAPRDGSASSSDDPLQAAQAAQSLVAMNNDQSSGRDAAHREAAQPMLDSTTRPPSSPRTAIALGTLIEFSRTERIFVNTSRGLVTVQVSELDSQHPFTVRASGNNPQHPNTTSDTQTSQGVAASMPNVQPAVSSQSVQPAASMPLDEPRRSVRQAEAKEKLTSMSPSARASTEPEKRVTKKPATEPAAKNQRQITNSSQPDLREEGISHAAPTPYSQSEIDWLRRRFQEQPNESWSGLTAAFNRNLAGSIEEGMVRPQRTLVGIRSFVHRHATLCALKGIIPHGKKEATNNSLKIKLNLKKPVPEQQEAEAEDEDEEEEESNEGPVEPPPSKKRRGM